MKQINRLEEKSVPPDVLIKFLNTLEMTNYRFKNRYNLVLFRITYFMDICMIPQHSAKK